MGRLFWSFMAILSAILIHISFVLFAPAYIFRGFSKLDDATRVSNQFVVLPQDRRRTLLPSLRGPGVAAYCDIDLSRGVVSITMQPPKTYWSLAVFSQTGKQLYALNEQQADTELIAIDFKRAPSLIEKVIGSGDEEENISFVDSAAWSVELADQHAYAVLWIPYPDTLQVGEGEQAMKASSCALKKKA